MSKKLIILTLAVSLICYMLYNNKKESLLPRAFIDETGRSQLEKVLLSINSDCQPVGLFTKIIVSSFNQGESKLFWQGQINAIDQEYKDEIKSIRLQKIDRLADRAISMIEVRRSNAYLKSAGVEPYNPAEIDKSNAEIDEEIDRSNALILKNMRDWHSKCLASAHFITK